MTIINRQYSKTKLIDNLELLLSICSRYNLQETADQIKDRIRDAKLPALAVIAGEGNFGKSSLINSLAGREIAPVSIIPLTWKVDIYRNTKDAESAEIRYVGKDGYEKVGIDEAKTICNAEEDRIRNSQGAKANIVEVIWNRNNLAFGSDICLVDTPGLEQAGLGVEIESDRLVSGLGSVYSIDEVWHYYYHKADIVLWVFDACKMESKGTYKSIDTLTKLQNKYITAIATKADKINKERWPEITKRYINIYESYFKHGLSKQLYITVCGGKTPLLGTGVDEVRQYLTGQVAINAEQIKLNATHRFIIDTATEINRILNLSAKQFVNNLRILSDTADECAIRLSSVVKEHCEQVDRDVLPTIRMLSGSLHSYLHPIFVDAIQAGDVSTVEDCVRTRMQSTLSSVEQTVNSKLRNVNQQVVSLAAALSKQHTLQRLTLGASGTISRNEFTFMLSMDAPQLMTFDVIGLHLSPIRIGFFKSVARFFGRLFGVFSLTTEEEERFNDYIASIKNQLAQASTESTAVFRRHLKSKIAPALSKAVSQSISETFTCDPVQVINMLGDVDSNIRQLTHIIGEQGVLPAQYANWARYWIADSRDVVIARKLITEVIWPSRSHLQQYIADYHTFRGKNQIIKTKFTMYFREKKPRIDIVPGSGRKSISEPSRNIMTRVLASYFRCGVTNTLVQVEFPLKDLIYQMGKKDIYDQIIADFQLYVKSDPYISSISDQIGQTIPDIVINKLSEVHSEVIGKVVLDELDNNTIVVNAKMEALQFFKWQIQNPLYLFPCLALSCSPFSILLVLISKYIFMLVFAGMIISSAVFALVSHCMLNTQIKHRALVSTNRCVDEWITSVTANASNHVNQQFFDELTSKLVIEVSPRPLQKLLEGELL